MDNFTAAIAKMVNDAVDARIAQFCEHAAIPVAVDVDNEDVDIPTLLLRIEKLNERVNDLSKCVALQEVDVERVVDEQIGGHDFSDILESSYNEVEFEDAVKRVISVSLQ